MGAMSCLVLLAACNQQQAEQPDAPQTTSNVTASTGSADNGAASEMASPPQGSETADRSAPATAPQSERRSCYLAVDKKVHVDGPCMVFPMGDGLYTLNTWDAGKPARSHFAILSKDEDGRVSASWNKDPDDTRAFDPLGVVEKVDGCWVNNRARICAR